MLCGRGANEPVCLIPRMPDAIRAPCFCPASFRFKTPSICSSLNRQLFIPFLLLTQNRNFGPRGTGVI
jgi:hypothetical protein